MQTATSETEIKSRYLSICVHHYTLRAPCPKGQGTWFLELATHIPLRREARCRCWWHTLVQSFAWSRRRPKRNSPFQARSRVRDIKRNLAHVNVLGPKGPNQPVLVDSSFVSGIP